MGSKPTPDTTDAATSSETLHETVLDGGRVIVRHKFKRGDIVVDEDGERCRIDGIFVKDGHAQYETDAIPSRNGGLSRPPCESLDRTHKLAPHPVAYFNAYAINCKPGISDAAHPTRFAAEECAREAGALPYRCAVIVIQSDGSVKVEDVRPTAQDAA